MMKIEDVTLEVIEYITTVYKENSPEFIYFVILYNIFNNFGRYKSRTSSQ